MVVLVRVRVVRAVDAQRREGRDLVNVRVRVRGRVRVRVRVRVRGRGRGRGRVRVRVWTCDLGPFGGLEVRVARCG